MIVVKFLYMVESTQKVYIHDVDQLSGSDKKTVVQLNTRGETPPKARGTIYEKISDKGLNLPEMSSELNEDIAKVQFNKKGEVEKVELMDWVKEEYI